MDRPADRRNRSRWSRVGATAPRGRKVRNRPPKAPDALIGRLTREFEDGLRKSWEAWARAGMVQFFEQLAPPKCDAWQTSICVGLVQTRSCQKGCGYVVHRCHRHGGTALGGAIGGHMKRCRYGSPSAPADDLQAKSFDERRINAERMLRCRSCSDLVWEGKLREHAAGHAVMPIATDAEVHALYQEPENPKGDDER